MVNVKRHRHLWNMLLKRTMSHVNQHIESHNYRNVSIQSLAIACFFSFSFGNISQKTPDCVSFCWSLSINSRRFICIVSSWITQNSGKKQLFRTHIATCWTSVCITSAYLLCAATFMVLVYIKLKGVDDADANLRISGDIKPRDSSLLQGVLLVYHFLIHFRYNLLIHHSLFIFHTDFQSLNKKKKHTNVRKP